MGSSLRVIVMRIKHHDRDKDDAMVGMLIFEIFGTGLCIHEWTPHAARADTCAQLLVLMLNRPNRLESQLAIAFIQQSLRESFALPRRKRVSFHPKIFEILRSNTIKSEHRHILLVWCDCQCGDYVFYFTKLYVCNRTALLNFYSCMNKPVCIFSSHRNRNTLLPEYRHPQK